MKTKEDYLNEMRKLSDEALLIEFDKLDEQLDKLNVEIREMQQSGADEEILEEFQHEGRIVFDKHQIVMDVLIGRDYSWQNSIWKKIR